MAEMRGNYQWDMKNGIIQDWASSPGPPRSFEASLFELHTPG